MKKFENVDEYIASFPKEIQPKLSEIRQIIKNNAPEAEEKISYGMPYYHYKGRLIYFGGNKKHIGVYVMHRKITENLLKEELKDYFSTSNTLHFSYNKPLPRELLGRIVRMSVEENKKLDRNK
jgi:uncharacterized protein YdhG (YjbR/CyaY superfamily)